MSICLYQERRNLRSFTTQTSQSSQIFVDAGATQVGALAASLGWGTLNWLAAAPAIFTIDRLGRRALLLIGYPAMSLVSAERQSCTRSKCANARALAVSLHLGILLLGSRRHR